MKYKSEVLNVIDEGIQLLEKYNVKWKDNLILMRNHLLLIKDKRNFINFLKDNDDKIFGGMGSLFDIFICEENGNIADNFDEANKELDKYREKLTEIWEAAINS